MRDQHPGAGAYTQPDRGWRMADELPGAHRQVVRVIFADTDSLISADIDG